MNEKLKYFADKGFLISPELLGRINSINKEIIENLSNNLVVINEDLLRCVEENKIKELNWIGFDDARVMLEKKGLDEEYNAFLDVIFERAEVSVSINGAETLFEQEKYEGGVVVLQSYNEAS